jgi:hypothetical protein
MVALLCFFLTLFALPQVEEPISTNFYAGWTNIQRSFIGGSNMNDETKPAALWDRTKAWAGKNRTISGALVGGAAGTIVPGLGTVIGAIVGAGVGFASSKEKKDDDAS